MPRNYLSETKINTEFMFLLDEQQNAETYYKQIGGVDISKSVSRPIPHGYSLVRSQTDVGFEISLLCHEKGRVLYYIKGVVLDDVFLGGKPVTQVLLWRTNNTDYISVTSGLADMVFRELLLEQYNIVVSDSNQTLQGRGFWERQLDYAISYNDNVYRYDRISCELTPITDRNSISTNKADLWGDSEEYEHILAVISKEKLDN